MVGSIFRFWLLEPFEFFEFKNALAPFTFRKVWGRGLHKPQTTNNKPQTTMSSTNFTSELVLKAKDYAILKHFETNLNTMENHTKFI